jgi:type IX secretion system PorP/SprF family membrane protein
MFYSNKVWLGVSAHHISQPNVSFVEGQISKLPMKLSAQGGIRFDLQGGGRNYITHAYAERSISFAFNYKQQDPFNQLDVGAQLFLDPLVLGIWYRGLPTKNGLPNNEAFIGLVGISLESGLDIGYSYDVTISKLGLRNSGGAHEVSITYSFLWGNPKSRNMRARTIPCFKY